MPDWQYIVAFLAVAAASAYLVWLLVRSVRAEKTGCGGCSTPSDTDSQPHVIPREQLRLRSRSKL